MSLHLQALLKPPRWHSGKESTCQWKDPSDADSIFESGRSPRGNSNPLQYSCLENPTYGKSHVQRILAGCSPWGYRISCDWATELNATTQFPISLMMKTKIPYVVHKALYGPGLLPSTFPPLLPTSWTSFHVLPIMLNFGGQTDWATGCPDI